jgi:hypothetical protein
MPKDIHPLSEQSEPLTQVASEPAKMASQPSPAQGVPQGATPSPPSVEQHLAHFCQDPESYIRQIVTQEAEKHLINLKETAELQGALNMMRKAQPDFSRFEPFILREVARNLQEDDDGKIAPWPDLLEQGLKHFKEKFSTLIKDKTYSSQPLQENPMTERAHMEGAQQRKTLPASPNFTAQQIEHMSLEEFLNHEADINQALKDGRIQ